LIAVRLGPHGDLPDADAEFIDVFAAAIAGHHQRRRRDQQHEDENPGRPRAGRSTGPAPDSQQNQHQAGEHRPFRVHGNRLARGLTDVQIEHGA